MNLTTTFAMNLTMNLAMNWTEVSGNADMHIILRLFYISIQIWGHGVRMLSSSPLETPRSSLA